MPSLDNPFDFPGINIKQGTAAGGGLTGTYPNPTVNAALLSFPAWTSYTPTLTTGSGTLTSATADGTYLQLGKLIFVNIHIAITTNGTAATNIRATLPATASNRTFEGTGREQGVSGKIVNARIPSSDNRVFITFYDNTYPGANGADISLNIFYQSV